MSVLTIEYMIYKTLGNIKLCVVKLLLKLLWNKSNKNVSYMIYTYREHNNDEFRIKTNIRVFTIEKSVQTNLRLYDPL